MRETIIRLALQDRIGPVLIHHLMGVLTKEQWHQLPHLSVSEVRAQTDVSAVQAKAIHTALHNDTLWQRHEKWCAKGQGRVITLLDSQYPSLLAAIAVPPIVLWVRGNAFEQPHRACALVGAREATAYAHRVVSMLVPALSQHGVITVSGGARGVDASVHERTLEHGGKTIVVAGCGLSTPILRIMRHFLLVSLSRVELLFHRLPRGYDQQKEHFQLVTALLPDFHSVVSWCKQLPVAVR